MRTIPRKSRRSLAQRIGRAGEHEIQARLTNFGWSTSEIDPDLGEDFIVSIMVDEGIPTGVDFYIQNKTTSVIDKKIKRGGYVCCELEPADIEYWDTKAIPVYIFVWDTTNAIGYWVFSKDAKAELEKRKPDWRDKKEVTIRIPVKNTTSDEGLRRLKRQVGVHYLPLLLRDQAFDLRANITFPYTPKGNATRSAFRRHLLFGDKVSIDSEFVGVTLPEWWCDIFDAEDVVPANITMSSESSGKVIPVRIELESCGDTEAPAQRVEFKAVQGGLEKLTLSNEHEESIFRFTLVLERSGKFSFMIQMADTDRVLSLRETRDALLLMKVLSEGARFQIVPLIDEAKQIALRGDLKPSPAIEFHELDPLRLVNDLLYIQKKADCTFPMPLDIEDPYQINEVANILREGRVTYESKDFSQDITLIRDIPSANLESLLSFHRSEDKKVFVFEGPEVWFELGGVRIELGLQLKHVQARIRIDDVTKIEALLSNKDRLDDAAAPTKIKLHFQDPSVVDEFPKWVPESKQSDAVSG